MFSLSDNNLGICGSKHDVVEALESARKIRDSFVFGTVVVPNGTIKDLFGKNRYNDTGASVSTMV